MRRAILALVPVVCGAALLTKPAPAAADTLDTVLGVLNTASAYGYNSCSYVRPGLPSAACQANRATSVLINIRRVEEDRRTRQRQRLELQNRQIAALQRACRAGDALSCERSGGYSDKQAAIVSALADACASGDKISCGRVEGLVARRDEALGRKSR